MEKKKIYFHVGTVKTGTTFIQKFCYDNRIYLRRNNLSYPYLLPPQLNLPRYANAGFLFDEKALQKSKRALERVSQSKILISEEGLMGNLRLINSSALEGFDKYIILYVRNPADLLASWCSERCAPYNASLGIGESSSGLISVENTLRCAKSDYIYCMKNLLLDLGDFPKSKIIIKPYERSQFYRGTLLNDFFNIIKVNIPYVEAVNLNESRTRKFCDISCMVWQISKELGLSDFFEFSLVKEVTNACKSGDDRPVIETLRDGYIEKISNDLKYIEEELSERFFKGEQFFNYRYPKCFGRTRSEYMPPDRSEVERLTRIALNRRVI